MRARKCTVSLQEVPTGAVSLGKSRPVLLRPACSGKHQNARPSPNPHPFFPAPCPGFWIR